ARASCSASSLSPTSATSSNTCPRTLPIGSPSSRRGCGWPRARAALAPDRQAPEPAVLARDAVCRTVTENALLAPTRTGRVRGPQVHDGKIITEMPDQMWGTDGTTTLTTAENSAWVFAAIDHCTGE